MAVTILYGDRPVSVVNATAEGNNLWLSLDDLRATTGWELHPQGLCLGEVCVPIPAGRAADFVRADGSQCNLAALARQLQQPAVHDDTHAVWCFGETANTHNTALQSAGTGFYTPRSGWPLAFAVRLSRQENSSRLVGILVRLSVRPVRVAGAL
jgi:hypothetical protein